MSKRPRRTAALAANKKFHDANCVVSVNLHATKSIALTSQDVLESTVWRDELYRGQRTTVVTLFCNARPTGLPRGTVHVGAAFDDAQRFDEAILEKHLDSMAARIEAAGTDRVVFVCQAGINRSTLALCYYCAKHGSCGSWEQAKTALVRAKGHASAGWPTLTNVAFETFLRRCFSSGSSSSSSSSKERRRPEVKVEQASSSSSVKSVKWFWRTVATARPGTGGPGTDPQAAATMRREWEERMRENGIDPKTGRTDGCWAGGRVGGRWIRGVPNEARPWLVSSLDSA